MMSKRILKISLLSVLIAVMVASVCYAQSSDYSNVASVFSLGMGARPLGMGGAFIGLANDESAVYYNPAGLAFLDSSGVTSLVSPQFGLAHYGALGLASRYFGINMLVLQSGNIPTPNDYGAPTGDTFDYYSGGGIGGAGISLSDSIAFGVRVKYYQSQLQGVVESMGTGWAVEPSMLVEAGPLRVGLLVENAFSQDIIYESGHRESWTRSLRLGFAVRYPLAEEVRLNLLGDVGGITLSTVQTQNLDSLDTHLGIEVWVDKIGVRAGVSNRSSTVGSSLRWQSWRIDWAYAAYHGDVPDTQRLSLTYRF